VDHVTDTFLLLLLFRSVYELLWLYLGRICGFACCAGIIDYLTTEISTSKQKKFSLVTFIDTPGLVDGDMKYPFDVNRAILWLGGSH